MNIQYSPNKAKLSGVAVLSAVIRPIVTRFQTHDFVDSISNCVIFYFLYFREANINQSNLDSFIAIAEELQQVNIYLNKNMNKAIKKSILVKVLAFKNRNVTSKP